MDVSLNGGTPKSSISMGIVHYKPSILEYPHDYGNPLNLAAGHKIDHPATWF